MSALKNARFVLFVALTPILLIASCGVAPFPGGVRVYAYEAPIESPKVSIGVGGVLDYGEWVEYNQGPQQSHGTQFTFSGTTDFDGIDDHPQAADNSVWYVSADFTAATENCTVGSNHNINIPPGGGTVRAACLLPPQ